MPNPITIYDEEITKGSNIPRFREGPMITSSREGMIPTSTTIDESIQTGNEQVNITQHQEEENTSLRASETDDLIRTLLMTK